MSSLGMQYLVMFPQKNFSACLHIFVVIFACQAVSLRFFFLLFSFGNYFRHIEMLASAATNIFCLRYLNQMITTQNKYIFIMYIYRFSIWSVFVMHA